MSYEISVGKMNRTIERDLSPIWDRALRDLNLRDMHGKIAADCLPHLASGMIKMVRYRIIYDTFEPEIGSGSYADALATLVEMAHECRHNPTGKVFVYTKTGQA